MDPDAALRDQCHWFKTGPLMEVARRLTEDDAHTLSFIYAIDTPSNCTTTLSKVLHVFKFLEKEGNLRPDRTGWDFLLKLLDDIPRLDIKDFIVKKYPDQGTCMQSYVCTPCVHSESRRHRGGTVLLRKE